MLRRISENVYVDKCPASYNICIIAIRFGGPYRTLGRFVPYVSKRFSTEFELQQVILKAH